MKLSFTKMQSLGNDFILIDNRKRRLKNISLLSQTLCNRRFGIGADQVLLLGNSKKADFAMRIFNADGSEVEMCGNGVRCLAKYIWDNKIKSKTGSLSIETLGGIIDIEKTGSLFKVDMGKPILDPGKIPVSITKPHSSPVIDHTLMVKNNKFEITCVSLGNPHAVIIVKDADAVPLETFGPLIENHRVFPNRTNVEFIQIMNKKNIKMRVWERGAGETMACGSGASASAVASFLLGHTERKITVHLPGGDLLINWSIVDGHVYMAGPADLVFEGTIAI
jgi:diaminopimelate epimerase